MPFAIRQAFGFDLVPLPDDEILRSAGIAIADQPVGANASWRFLSFQRRINLVRLAGSVREFTDR